MKCGKRTNKKIACAFLAGALVFGAVKPVIGEIAMDSAITAIQRRICYETYWWGSRSFVFGKTVTGVIRRDGDMAYAWFDDLEHGSDAPYWASMYEIFTKGGLTAVSSSYGYNIDTTKGEEKDIVFRGRTEPVQVTVPSDCEPKFDPDTPEKARMIAAIEKSMKMEFRQDNKNGGHYPERVKMIVANFNIDYPFAYVLVPGTGEVFSLPLRDDTAPMRDLIAEFGEYMVAEERHKPSVRVLTQRIRKYGIAREIRLSGN